MIFLWKLLLWDGESQKGTAERDEKKKQLEKQTAVTERKIRREKQLNQQIEMNAEMKKEERNMKYFEKFLS